jgi:hypothetical protein
METLTLKRIYEKTQTRGILTGPGINLVTMELKWLNNLPQKSCIPEGTYIALPRTSPKYGKHFHIQNVPHRDLILVHPANFASDLLGCIGAAKSFADLNGDGIMDVASSKAAMKILLDKFPKGFEIHITA